MPSRNQILRRWSSPNRIIKGGSAGVAAIVRQRQEQMVVGGGALFSFEDDVTWTRTSQAAWFDPITATFVETGYREKADVSDFNTWTQNGTPLLTTGVADPDGGTNAVTIEDDDGGGYESVSENLGTTVGAKVGGNVRARVRVKAVSGTGILQANYTIAGGDIVRPQLDLSDGSTAIFSTSGSPQNVATSATDLGDGWYLWETTFWTAYSGANFSGQFYPAINTTLGGQSPSATGAATFYKLEVDTHAAYVDNATARILPGGGALIESARTNELPWSDKLDEVAWNGAFATRAVSALAAPDGGVAYEVQDPDSGALAYIQDSTLSALSVGNTYCASCFQEKGAGTVSAIVLVGDITGGNIVVRLDSDTGGVHVESGSPGAVTVEDAGDYWRVSFTFTMVTSVAITFRFFPARALTLTGGNTVTATGALAVWGCQIEQGDFPTSPIRTAGGLATRAVEFGTLPSAAVPAVMLSGRWSYDWQPIASKPEAAVDGEMQLAFAGGADVGNRIHTLPTTGEYRVRANAVIQGTTTALNYSRLARITSTLRPADGEFEIQGATAGNGVYVSGGGPWTWPGGDVSFGNFSTGAGESFNGIMYPPVAA